MLGYNWQQGSFVYGLEGDWSWTGTKADHDDPSEFIGSFDVNWLATIRGRVGIALDSMLFYVTGGGAFGHVKNTFPIIRFSDGPASAWIQDQTKAGWVVGGGFEYMFTPHWTARAEFRYVDLGKTTIGCAIVTGADNFCLGVGDGTFRNTLKLGLVGLNYKF